MLPDLMRSEIERHAKLLEIFEANPASYTSAAHQRMHRMSRRFLQGVMEIHDESALVCEQAKKGERSDAKTIGKLRDALGDLEKANNRLAAKRSPAAYNALIKSGEADDLVELDRTRLNAQNLLRETDPARQIAPSSS